MPKDQDLRMQFNNVVGTAFAGNPSAADYAYQSVKAYYAGVSARKGNVSGDLDGALMKQSVTAVLGGVSNVNGKGDVVRPWGMTEALWALCIAPRAPRAVTRAAGRLLLGWAAS